MTNTQVAIQSNIWENNSILKQKRDLSHKQNYIPFLFRSKRQFPFTNKQIPPVCAYQVKSVFDTINLSNLSHQPQILKQQFKKKNQMCIFKSNQQRFSLNKNDIPGPASYNLAKNKSKANMFKALNQKVDINKNKQKFQLIKRSPSCPAIPDSKVRYGYAKDPLGNYKLIQKSQNQVIKQKQKLKEYCSTLVGQNTYQKYSRIKQTEYLSTKVKNQHKIITNLQKYVNKKSNSLSQIPQNATHKTLKINKPKVKLSHGANVVKYTDQHLGPGCYNVSLDTLKKSQKNQSFQFFSSSQIRFSPIQKQSNLNPYENMFNEKKLIKIKPNFQGKIYKKSFPTSVDPTCFEKIDNPGPGYYQPQDQKVKKYRGNIRFGYESRFKDNYQTLNGQNVEHPILEQIQADDGAMKWGNLRKQKIKSPHKEFEPVKQQQIYGIMNEEPSQSCIKLKKTKLKDSKNNESAVFLDKSSRLNLTNKTYYEGEFQMNSKQNDGSRMWDTKGSFISRLPKKYIQMKENTPGPGTYQKNKLGKKSFNLKNN